MGTLPPVPAAEGTHIPLTAASAADRETFITNIQQQPIHPQRHHEPALPSPEGEPGSEDMTAIGKQARQVAAEPPSLLPLSS